MLTRPDIGRLSAALEAAGSDGLTQSQISIDVFGRHVSAAQLERMLAELEADGRVEYTRIPSNGSRKGPIKHWRSISHSDISGSNGNGTEPENVEGPPPGDGWLPLRETRFRAARLSHARPRRTGRQTLSMGPISQRPQEPRAEIPLSPEYRGGRHLSNIAYRSYLASGVIEVQGEWVRLARNPPTRPPPPLQ